MKLVTKAVNYYMVSKDNNLSCKSTVTTTVSHGDGQLI